MASACSRSAAPDLQVSQLTFLRVWKASTALARAEAAERAADRAGQDAQAEIETAKRDYEFSHLPACLEENERLRAEIERLRDEIWALKHPRTMP